MYLPVNIMYKKIVPLLVVVLIFLSSCGNRYVLNPDELEDVLVDIYLAEGIALQNSADFRTAESKLNLYSSVYEKNGIDKALLDSTLRYYSDDAMLLSEIYENVYQRIESLEKKIKDGDFVFTRNMRSEKYYKLIVEEDKSLLPHIKHELWTASESYDFNKNDFENFDAEILVDSIIGDFNFRFSLAADSMASLNCKVLFNYTEGADSMNFIVPLDSGMVELKWKVKEGLHNISFSMIADKMNKNSKCCLSAFRLYNLDQKNRTINIFDE